MNVVDVKISIPDEIDITIHGNIFAKLAETFKALYRNTLREQMERHLEQRIRDQFPRVLNREAEERETLTKITDNFVLDWHLSGLP